ncbi:MAG: hypothetical protein ACRCTQ_02865 [Brevinemataceae bacterium]
MKKIIRLFFLTIPILFIHCNKGIEPTIKEFIINYELPVYFVINNQNNLIPQNQINNKIMHFNTKKEVQSYFTETFLENYPDYLNVDFSKYSLLVQTTCVYYNINKRVIRFYWSNTEKKYRYNVDYYTTTVCDDESYYIERTAIIIDKIEGPLTIEASYSIFS